MTDSAEAFLNQTIIDHIRNKNLCSDMQPYLEKAAVYALSDPPGKGQVMARSAGLDILRRQGFAVHEEDIYPLLETVLKNNPDFMFDAGDIYEKTKDCPAVRDIENYESLLDHLLHGIIFMYQPDRTPEASPGLLDNLEHCLSEATGEEWHVEDYPFERILFGSVDLGKPYDEGMEAGIVICDKEITDIQYLLTEIGLNAPFQIIDYSNNLQILSWADREYLLDIIEIVKKTDQ